MNLVIVESPTKARTLSKYLDATFRVEATMGHVRDLPKKKIGVSVNGGVKMDYVVIEKKDERVNELKKIAKESAAIFLATDPDREGEAIAWHISQLLKTEDRRKKTDPEGRLSKSDVGPLTSNLKPHRQFSILNPQSLFSRIVFHEITEHAILESFKHPRTIDMPLVNAQQARRALDRLVGYKLSPLLWRKVRRGLSAGRVQSVAVRLIVEKEREIEKFVPEEYWAIQALLARMTNDKSQMSNLEMFWVTLVERDGAKIKITNGAEAQDAVSELEEAGYQVVAIEKKELRRTPPPPFTTSTLQQIASNKMGMTAKRIMQIAQSLYEEGLITYHRTDSTNMAMEAVTAAKVVIEKEFGPEYALSAPRFYKTKSKVAQEAHEAIRPTDPARINVEHEGRKLYELIWNRFMATQMAEAVVDQTTVRVSAEGAKHVYILETKGEVMKFAGWSRLYQTNPKFQISNPNKVRNLNDQNGIDENTVDDQRLPELIQGEELNKSEIKSEQKFTQPPARFNEASLIKALEELGIGRPSTYAPTITTIVDRQYVEREARRLKPTVLGFAVNDFLVEYFPNIVDYQFTAKMEDELDSIANGNLDWEKVIKEFYIPFSEKLTAVGEVAERVAVETEATGEKCPDCKVGDIVIRLGKFGKFLSCSRFPECKYKANYVQVVEGVKCPKDGGDIIIKKTRTGKSFYGCSSYPKCDFASWTRPTPRATEGAAKPKQT